MTALASLMDRKAAMRRGAAALTALALAVSVPATAARAAPAQPGQSGSTPVGYSPAQIEDAYQLAVGHGGVTDDGRSGRSLR